MVLEPAIRAQMRPVENTHQNIYINQMLWQGVQMTVVATALGAITQLAMQKAQSYSKWNVAPFKGEIPPDLAFATLCVAYTHLGFILTKPDRLKNFHTFLSEIRAKPQTIQDDTMIERNLEHYGAKEAILGQLNAPRYDQLKEGANGNAGTLLLAELTEKGMHEGQAVRLLNQLEHQVFAAPIVDLTQFFDSCVAGVTVDAVDGQSATGRLQIDGDTFKTEITRQLNIRDGSQILGQMRLTVEVNFPKEAGGPETASYRWEVTKVEDFIN